MGKRFFLFLGLILGLSLIFFTAVLAQTDDNTPTESVLIDPVSVTTSVDEAVPTLYGETQDITESVDQLDGIVVSVPDAVPTGWGIFWRGVRERVSIAFTFDPVKKAEKQLQFAEERMAIAEKMAETDSEQVQEKVQAMVERAQNLIAKAQEKKDQWANQTSDQAEKLVKNMATHQVRVQEALNRIEANIPEDKMAKWDDLRTKVEEKSQNFVNAFQVGNVPELVKEHLQAVKDKISIQLQAVKQYRDEKKDLLDAVKNGDESAKEQLQVLQEERKQTLEQNREEFKQQMELRQEKKDDLREAASQGDGQAKAQLKVMNKVDAVIKDKVENKLKKMEDKPLPPTKPMPALRPENGRNIKSSGTQAGLQ